jgi:hypothetical protein
MSLMADAAVDPHCLPCDYDVNWVFEHPSTLIWADSIIVSPTIMDFVEREQSPSPEDPSSGKIIRTFFNVAADYGLIDVRDPKGLLPEEFHDAADAQVKTDFSVLPNKELTDVSSDGDKREPDQIEIEDSHYCGPRILSLYYSIALARIWDAKLLLNQHTKKYLSHRFGTEMNRNRSAFIDITAFSQVFYQRLPEIDIVPPDAYQKCRECNNLEDCRVEYFDRSEKSLREYIKIRDYDEIHQMKNIFNHISARIDAGSSPDDIVSEFKEVENKLLKQFKSIFPKVLRWSKLSTIVSIPIIIAGATTGQQLITGLGAGVAGISKTIEKYLEYLQSKNRWVCFSQSNRSDNPKK